ncbi:MAG TPA: hypothetical protein VGA27_07955 [Candidatus Binatia bacterium]
MPRFEDFLCVAVLISRLGDIGTTYLASPKLILESNPLARKFRWPFALATLTVCFLPYYSAPFAVMVLVASLLVSASNAARLWWLRVMGEERFYQLMLELAALSKPLPSIICILIPPFFIFLLAGLLLFFYPSPTDWGYYFACGVASYAFVLTLYGPLFYLKLRKTAVRQPSYG